MIINRIRGSDQMKLLIDNDSVAVIEHLHLRDDILVSTKLNVALLFRVRRDKAASNLASASKHKQIEAKIRELLALNSELVTL